MSKEINGAVLSEFDIDVILEKWNKNSNSRRVLCRNVEEVVASRCRTQGGITSDNITQAAANKAAEEGGLPLLPKKTVIDQHIPTGIKIYGHSDAAMCRFAREAIAADRASRQVSNKAEVEPVVPQGFSWPEPPKGGQSHVLLDDGYVEGWAKAIETVRNMLATPPATTGASTILTDPSMPRDMRQAVEWIIGLRARVDSLLDVIEAEREVVAQAGQVAVPDSRFLHSKEAADDEPKVDSTRLSFWRQGWNAYRNAVLAAAPSPAKESK